MRVKSFNVPLYNYKVTVYEIDGEADSDVMRRRMRALKMPQDDIDEICCAVEGAYDGGYTFFCAARKQLVVILLPFSSEMVRRRVLNHEKRHVEDDILQDCGVDDKEAAAYLAGFLSEKMH